MGVGAHGWVVDTAGHVNDSFSRARLQASFWHSWDTSPSFMTKVVNLWFFYNPNTGYTFFNVYYHSSPTHSRK